MDERWESEVVEYGALNITGFRIVDVTKPHVKEFLEGKLKMVTTCQSVIIRWVW